MRHELKLGDQGEKSERNEFSEKLEEILSRGLPMEDADEFFETAISDLAQLSEQIRSAYLGQAPEAAILSSREIEDAVRWVPLSSDSFS